MDSEQPQYHILPKDDPQRVVDILRKAAGLPPMTPPSDVVESPST